MARSSVDRARDRVARVASHVDASSATRDDGRDARARAMAAHVASNAAGAVVHASDDATPWIDVDQRRIDAFAACADDHQFIHARDAPAGAIAHGFLTLSLLTPATASRTTPAWSSRAVNYGLNRVRFVAPVRAGRARSRAVDQNRRLSRVTRRRGRRDRVFSRIRNRAERARRRGVASRARVGRVLGRPSLRLSGPRFASSRALVSLFSPPSSSLEPIVALRGSDSSNNRRARRLGARRLCAAHFARARSFASHRDAAPLARAGVSRGRAARATRLRARLDDRDGIRAATATRAPRSRDAFARIEI